MHTVDLLEEAIVCAKQLGFRVRQEWLGGDSGGSCEIRGEAWLFIDLALSPTEQLYQVIDAIGQLPDVDLSGLSPKMQRLYVHRRTLQE